jgi:hypothetical protein
MTAALGKALMPYLWRNRWEMAVPEAVDAALAAIGAQWQDIATAPKDGTEVMVVTPNYENAIPAKWFEKWTDGGAWVTPGYSQAHSVQPTHWQPLPPPPGDR